MITGGAGFIGSHVVRLFVKKYPEYRILNVDKLTTWLPINPAPPVIIIVLLLIPVYFFRHLRTGASWTRSRSRGRM